MEAPRPHQPLRAKQDRHQEIGDEARVERPEPERCGPRERGAHERVRGEERAPDRRGGAAVSYLRRGERGLAQPRDPLDDRGAAPQRPAEHEEEPEVDERGYEQQHAMIPARLEPAHEREDRERVGDREQAAHRPHRAPAALRANAARTASTASATVRTDLRSSSSSLIPRSSSSDTARSTRSMLSRSRSSIRCAESSIEEGSRPNSACIAARSTARTSSPGGVVAWDGTRENYHTEAPSRAIDDS